LPPWADPADPADPADAAVVDLGGAEARVDPVHPPTITVTTIAVTRIRRADRVVITSHCGND
jgi:hypothetical protein